MKSHCRRINRFIFNKRIIYTSKIKFSAIWPNHYCSTACTQTNRFFFIKHSDIKNSNVDFIFCVLPVSKVKNNSQAFHINYQSKALIYNSYMEEAKQLILSIFLERRSIPTHTHNPHRNKKKRICKFASWSPPNWPNCESSPRCHQDGVLLLLGEGVNAETGVQSFR